MADKEIVEFNSGINKSFDGVSKTSSVYNFKSTITEDNKIYSRSSKVNTEYSDNSKIDLEEDNG